MMKRQTLFGSIMLGTLCYGTAICIGQAATAGTSLQFDVVSIKPHPLDRAIGLGVRWLPDGTFMMTSQAIVSIIPLASPVPVDVSGLPAWTKTERYDIVAKPAPDSHPTREQRVEMMRNMLVDRLRVAGHVEERERRVFALVVARRDGRLGPQLKTSTVDCAPRPSPCLMRMRPGSIEAKGITLDRLVRSLSGFADGEVINRTGLDGPYDFTLHFALPRMSADPSALVDDGPQLVTAVQEQLGLKLVPEKVKVRIFVIDHIERPTPD